MWPILDERELGVKNINSLLSCILLLFSFFQEIINLILFHHFLVLKNKKQTLEVEV